MDNVLIVDGDKENLNVIKEGLERLNQFKVLIATDGQEAIGALEKQRISVLVTDINLPQMDGLELLAHMTRKHSATPCIVMTEYGKPWFKKKMVKQNVLYHIEKPIDIVALFHAIDVGLHLLDEGIAHGGMSMSSFLPLIEMAQKTCRLEVKSADKGKGYLYFNEGVLIDAHYNGQSGENAAVEMIGWSKIALNFSELPRRRTSKRVISELMDMAGATWNRDDIAVAGEKNRVIEPVQTPDKPPTHNAVLEGIIALYKEELRTIKGYQLVSILDQQGHLQAYDSVDESLDIHRLGAAFSQVMASSQEASTANGLDECREITIHTCEAIILVLGPAVGVNVPFQIIGMISAEGNWYFMKFQLGKLLRRITAELSSPQD